jgi:hypothetical protein
MRYQLPVSLGLALMVPMLSVARIDAEGGILSRLHHRADCDAHGSTVRLPAQEIRIETTRPRVIVHESSARTRGFFPAAPAFVPYGQGPFVATFLPMTGHGASPFCAPTADRSSGVHALRALHEMEIQGAEVQRLRAAHQAEMDHLDKVHQRVRAGMAPPSTHSSATSAEIEQLKTAIENLTKKVSDIERLLIIHDNILMKQHPAK